MLFESTSSPDMHMPMPAVRNGYRQSSSPFHAALARSLCFTVVLMLTASPLFALDQERRASIHNSILALDSARETALLELEGLSSASGELSDYRDFVVYLNSRIASYCMELAEQSGTLALEGLPCPAGQRVTGAERAPTATGDEIFYTTGSGSIDARTQAEKTADLDGDFLTSLGDFDEMLLKEEDKVAARVPSQRESSGSGQAGATGSDGSSGGTAEPGAKGSGESGDTGNQGAATAGDVASKGGGGEQADQSGTVPGTQREVGTGDGDLHNSAYGVPGGKLPPPKDDDIVARQLREAAEKEPDPELKQKLWEEYWKYKGVRK